MTGVRVLGLLPLLAAFVVTACGADQVVDPGPGPPGPPAAIVAVLGDGQRATVATALSVQPTVRVLDAGGKPVAGTNVSFAVTAGGGWTVTADVTTDHDGRAATTWYLGPTPGPAQRLTATTGAGSALTFTATADPPVAGATYFGADGYVEFTAGTLPLIVGAPHGGTLRPAGIPDRTGAGITTVRDANTDELAANIHDALVAAVGDGPHTIIVHLHRVKLDANREIAEAAQGNAAAERAWREYHGFIEAARERVVADHERGLFVDLHGHGHPIQRLELGYLLSAADLAGNDAALDAPATVQSSSIRALAATSPLSHSALLRGPLSLGTLFAGAGYAAVPSSDQPDPGGDPYFTGGYNTRRHGSRDGGPIDAVQLEANMQGVRDNAATRSAFAEAFAGVVLEFLETHYRVGQGAASLAGR